MLSIDQQLCLEKQPSHAMFLSLIQSLHPHLILRWHFGYECASHDELLGQV